MDQAKQQSSPTKAELLPGTVDTPAGTAETAAFHATDQERKPVAADLPGERYEILGEIGRGGMGAVYRAIDRALQRPLALKVMREDLPIGGEAEQRFLEEARITGQLQHPGIAPVHEVGRLDGARPFFAMKLIEGRTLGEMLAERSSPQADVPRFLQIFEQIAQTLAYAHSQGVIHRDLKPANVMVGAFGEVQVMDWGLARRVVSGQLPEVRSQESTLTAENDDKDFERLTAAGQILGTPAYMPPEQARGDLGAMDKRSDVFGLGAILFETLTGKPPFVGAEGRSALKRAAAADLSDAFRHAEACGADLQLIALVKQCLAPQPENRPRDAGAVAQQISSFLTSVQDRLKAAEVQQAEDRARAIEGRKRRRVTLALAGCAVLLVVGVGVVALRSYQGQIATNARRTQIEAEVTSTLLDSSKPLETIHRQLADPIAYRALLDEPVSWSAALATVRAGLQRIDSLLQNAPAEIDSTLAVRRDELKAKLEAADRDRQLAEKLETIRLTDGVDVKGKWTNVAVVPKYVAAFAEAGFDVEQADSTSLGLRMRASVVRWSLVAALDHWAASARSKGDDYVERLLHTARETDPHPFRDAFRTIKIWRDRVALAKLTVDPQCMKQSPQFIEALAWVYSNAGADALPMLRTALSYYPRDYWLLLRAGFVADTPSAAAGYFRAAIAVRPTSTTGHLNLGKALTDLGHHEEALVSNLRGLELDPNSPASHFNVALSLDHLDRLDEAMPHYQRSLDLDATGGWAPGSHTGIGRVHAKHKRVAEASAAYERAIATDPKYAMAHHNLGLLYGSEGDHDKGIAYMRKALELDPKFALAHKNIGRILRLQKKLPEAVAEYRKALELDPKDAGAHIHLGLALHDLGKVDEAEACFKRAIEADPKDAHAYRNLAALFERQEKLAEATAIVQKALAVNPNDHTAHEQLGNILRDQNKANEALGFYRKSLKLNPQYADAHFGLGVLYQRQKKFSEAIKCYEEAVRLEPDKPRNHNNLGTVLFDGGRVDDALVQYRKCLQLNPNYERAHYNLAVALDAKGKTEEAIAAYRKEIELDPKHANAHRNLGLVLKRAGRFAEALPLFKRGHELGAKQPGWRDPTGDNIKDCQRLLTADTNLPAVLRGEFEPKTAAEYIDLADLCRQYKKRHADAVKFYQGAFAKDAKLLHTPASARYNGACAAVLAATSSDPPSDSDRAALRKQALDWLQGELSDYRKLLDAGKPADRKLVVMMTQHLPVDKDLAAVREPAATARFPTDEQNAWRQLWATAEMLRLQALKGP